MRQILWVIEDIPIRCLLLIAQNLWTIDWPIRCAARRRLSGRWTPQRTVQARKTRFTKPTTSPPATATNRSTGLNNYMWCHWEEQISRFQTLKTTERFKTRYQKYLATITSAMGMALSWRRLRNRRAMALCPHWFILGQQMIFGSWRQSLSLPIGIAWSLRKARDVKTHSVWTI